MAKNDFPHTVDCLGKPATDCTVVHGKGLRVVVMGDSDAQMWIPALEVIARERSWTLSVASYPTCPWQDNLQALYPTRAACKARQNDWYTRVIPALDPGLVILTHQGLDYPNRQLPFVLPDGTAVFGGSPRLEQGLQSASSAALHALERPGRRIVILEPIPNAPPGTDPLACLSLGGAPSGCSYQADPTPTPLTRYYRSLARSAPITSVDTNRFVCPRFPTCDAIVRNIIVKRDLNHLTATFSRSVAPELSALIPR